MKTTKLLPILMTIAFLSFSNSTFGQLEHTITLNVDTGRIIKQDVNLYCNFGQDEEVSSEDYTITLAIALYNTCHEYIIINKYDTALRYFMKSDLI